MSKLTSYNKGYNVYPRYPYEVKDWLFNKFQHVRPTPRPQSQRKIRKLKRQLRK